MSFKYSYNTIVYTGEDYATQSARVAKYGYDAIELVGEPTWYDFKEVNKINADNGIRVSSICSIFMEGRDLIHSEKQEREKAINYCKEIADMTGEVGGFCFASLFLCQLSSDPVATLVQPETAASLGGPW